MITYDLSLLLADQMLAGFGDVGEAVSGPEKAAQRFASAFLTIKGSKPYDTTYGTTFITAARNGAIRTELDVTVYFNQAAADVMYYLNQQLTGNEPNDEVVASVTLDHFELNQPYLKLYVNMLTNDGITRQLVMPVSALGS